jgi:choline dehydrogenase
MIYGMQYTRASVAEIKGWERLGAKGWTWDSLWPFYKDLESFKSSAPEQSQPGIDINPEYHGMTDDVAVSYPTQMPTGSLSSNLAKIWG